MASSTNVFISYAADTKPLAEELATALEQDGLAAWVDFKDLHPGQRWKETMERAIDEAQWLVILVGSNSRATRWQEAEWMAVLASADDKDKKLLPVVFGTNDPPPFLRHWVSLKIDLQMQRSGWTRHVLETLHRFRNQVVHSQVPNEQRRQRLNELRTAAEKLQHGPEDESPAAPESQPE